MDSTQQQVKPAFAQPSPLRPYQYPSRYRESDQTPYGGRPLSVPASHVLRSNSFPNIHNDIHHDQPGPLLANQHSSIDQHQFANLPDMGMPSPNSFMMPSSQMVPPWFQPSPAMAYFPHQPAMRPFARQGPYLGEDVQPVFHRQPLRKRYKGGAGPFPCPKCGRFFRRRSDMQRHQRKRIPCAPADTKSEPARSPAPPPQLKERPNAAAYHNAGINASSRRYGDLLAPPSKLEDDYFRQSE